MVTIRRALVPLGLAALAVTVAAGPSRAGTTSRVSVDGFVGPTSLDTSFASYRWDVGPRASWTARIRARRGRMAVAARIGRTHATQASGIPGADADVSVALTSLDLQAQLRLFSIARCDAMAHLASGRMHLGWRPDESEVALPGSGERVSVRYAPVDEWVASVGMSLERDVTASMAAVVEVEGQWFDLDTMHRAGGSLESGRERFGNWALRVGLSWTPWSPAGGS